MATSKFYRDTYDEFSCTICMEQYNDSHKLPKMLPCAHTFCKTCIKQYADQHFNGFNCPLCSTKVNISAKDVEKLNNNLTLISFMDKLKVTPDDKVNAKEVKEKAKMDCNQHGREAQHICLSCNVPLCAKCMLGKEHRAHDLALIEDFYSDRIVQIRSNGYFPAVLHLHIFR